MQRAFLFPGQGAQYTGMGRDFYEKYPAARAVFEQSASVLGPGFLDVIFSGPDEMLQQTEYTQPAILTVSVAICRVLEALGFRASALAGLSLGEYSALVAAGALSFEEALPLVQKRGRFMQKATPAGQGKMVALMGLPHTLVEKICAQARDRGEVVTPANYNCPGQIVISGHEGAVGRAVALARQAGAKKVTELKVSAPFHCSLMQPVEALLRDELNRVTIRRPEIPVVFNVSACYASDPDQIRANLVRQVSSPILWERSVRTLIASGVNLFVGLGPGSSLSRLMKRIDPAVGTISIENTAALSLMD